ncbi:hypothetical protein OsI_38137 [Oryza sativa Indica Group]|uniref:Uncharacterized protein n=1 Tax=Oryza sativa subsp. indica TaxID=39946 RepID=B8BPC4_ORYSI|nr:hypothetical protein OsI_38137 [Oryza sativa Indica Group]
MQQGSGKKEPWLVVPPEQQSARRGEPYIIWLRRLVQHQIKSGSHAYSGSDKSTKPCGRNQHARCSQPNRCTKLGHYTRSDYHKRTQESHCIKPYKEPALATGPSSAAALAARSTLSSGGRPIVVRATTFKKDRSRAGAATRATERKKKKAMLQTSVVSIQAVAPGPTAKVIPATTSKRNSVVAPSMPVAFSRVNEMSPPNTPSFDLVLTLAATDQPKTTNGSTAQRNKVSKSTENLNLELTLGTLG